MTASIFIQMQWSDHSIAIGPQHQQQIKANIPAFQYGLTSARVISCIMHLQQVCMQVYW